MKLQHIDSRGGAKVGAVAMAASILSGSCDGGSSGQSRARHQGNGESVYVALGDSSGVGYGAAQNGGYVPRLHALMRRSVPGAKLRNLCMNGATSADVLRRQVPVAVEVADIGLITLQIGVNDLSRQVPVSEFGRVMEAIVKALVATGAPVIVGNLPDVSLAPIVPPFARGEIASRVASYNDQITQIAHRNGVILVDIHGPSRPLIPVHPEWFSSDGFHPSDAGYAFWAEQMWPAVMEALNSQR